MIDLEWVQRLIRMVDESDIDSLEISRLATRVKISKSPPQPNSGPVGVPVAGAAQQAPASPPSPDGGGGQAAPAAPEPAGGGEAAEATSAAETESDLHEVESPMVGTFYRAPAPDAPAYVEVGDRVETGQTLCILEAMKLMNELEAEVSGVIEEICVENAEPVEYGEVLFRVDTVEGG